MIGIRVHELELDIARDDKLIECCAGLPMMPRSSRRCFSPRLKMPSGGLLSASLLRSREPISARFLMNRVRTVTLSLERSDAIVSSA